MHSNKKKHRNLQKCQQNQLRSRRLSNKNLSPLQHYQWKLSRKWKWKSRKKSLLWWNQPRCQFIISKAWCKCQCSLSNRLCLCHHTTKWPRTSKCWWCNNSSSSTLSLCLRCSSTPCTACPTNILSTTLWCRCSSNTHTCHRCRWTSKTRQLYSRRLGILRK